MGHTYTNLLYHGVFSTSHRRPVLPSLDLDSLTRVVGGIIRDRNGSLLAFNAAADHVHLLGVFHPQESISDMLDMFRDIKAISSDCVHSRHPHAADFAWQRGYGAFSVSRSNAPAVIAYIASQAGHHKTTTCV